jgi:sulfatase modifying factor 1
VCTGSTCVGQTSTARSCTTPGPGRTDCGLDGGESCCASNEVNGGSYFRSYGSSSATPSDLTAVSGFRLDRYLVTVGRFREFVEAGAPAPAEAAGKHVHLNDGKGLTAVGGGYEPGWSTSNNGNIDAASVACSAAATWTAQPGSGERLPINCVLWYTAYAFCVWDGGFLPSESEWEYVAAAGNQQREYPWGSAAPGPTFAIYGCNYPADANGTCTSTSPVNIAPVGTARSGVTFWNQLDLVGDVSEWNLDAYEFSFQDCTDCVFLDDAGSSLRSLRGGSYKATGAYNMTSTEPFGFAPASHSDTIGVRCARAP